MATNTLTGLIPTIYEGLSEVSRELIGFIPNVSVNAEASGAAVGQVVRSPVAGVSALENITPGAVPANTGEQTTTFKDITITNSKAYPIKWNGEEQLSIGANGEYNTILADQFKEGFRLLSNTVEADLAGLYSSTTRAYGTSGTTPFGTADVHTDFAQSNKMLDDLGAPAAGRAMILGSAAVANVEGIQSGLFKVNEAGDGGAMLRNRQSRDLHGFTMGKSAGVVSHTKGTGADYLINDATSEVGDTTITVDGGTGTVLAGDVVSFAGDTNKYVVKTALAGGSFTIPAPGLLVA